MVRLERVSVLDTAYGDGCLWRLGVQIEGDIVKS